MKTTKLLWPALIGGALLAPSLATAVNLSDVEFDAALGMSNYSENTDGLWWDGAFEHEKKTSSPAFELGATLNLIDRDSYGLDVRGELVYFGNTSIHALIPTHETNTTQGHWSSDGNDFVGANPSNPCYGVCTNMSTFDGHGNSKGVAIEVAPYYIYKEYKISLLAGYYWHKDEWVENVTHLDGVVPGTFMDGSVQSTAKTTRDWVVGAQVKRGNFTVRYEYFNAKPLYGDPYRKAWTGVQMITMGWTFK